MKVKEINLTTNFKKQVTKSVVSILLFALTYVLILSLSVALTAACVYAGIIIMVAMPGIITIALGLGISSIGILILLFLLKFIFKKHSSDFTGLVEITSHEEPKLFELINEIIVQLGTSYPRKVFLSNDVNASVSFSSSFWSMFFPSKKNLQIGLGLINSVTEEELRAILAHEFGHFSQKTMKLGSYVYNVNQVIFNMLYDNNSYEKLIHTWSSVSVFISIFVMLAARIIQGIQWILKLLYEMVNKSYMALSREMEFHADHIAVSYTGSEPLKKSLLRMSLAEYSFNTVLSFYESHIFQNLKSENIYKEQLFVMNFLAAQENVQVKSDFANVTLNDLNKFNRSKLNIKDQWASHPTLEERIERIESVGLDLVSSDSVSAINIFKDAAAICKRFTNKLFSEVKYSDEVVILQLSDFEKKYTEEYNNNTFSKEFNGYYDNKNPLHFDLKVQNASEQINIRELYSEKMQELVLTSRGLEEDMEMLDLIKNKTIQVKSFDYDGVRYKRRMTGKLLKKLKLESDKVNAIIKENDIKIFTCLLREEQLQNKSKKLERHYSLLFEYDKNFERKNNIYIELSKSLEFINYTTPNDTIISNLMKVRQSEFDLKKSIKELTEIDLFKSEINNEMKDNFDLYLSTDLIYFDGTKYSDENLEILFTSMNNYAFLLSRGFFILKKNLLDYQVDLMIKSKKMASFEVE